MALYRCYFLSSDDRIRAAEDLEVETAGQAVEVARKMLRLRPSYEAIELWEGARKIYRSPPRRKRPYAPANGASH